MRPVLTVAIPAIPRRLDLLQKLLNKLEAQRAALPDPEAVEILAILDSCRMTIGEKRQHLVELASGEYVAQLDDDDDISDEYLPSLVEAARAGRDCVTFRQRVVWDGLEGEVVFGVNNENETFRAGSLTKRGVWHVCAVRRDLAKRCMFPPRNWGEDYHWVQQLREFLRTEIHVPKVLHYYTHTPKLSEAKRRTETE